MRRKTLLLLLFCWLMVTAALWPLTRTPTPATATLPALELSAQRSALLPSAFRDLDGATNWDRYVMALSLNPAEHSIQGRLRLDYSNRTGAPLGDLALHLYPNHADFAGQLRVQDVLVNGLPAPTLLSADALQLRIGFTGLPNAILEAGQSVRIELAFRVQTSRDASANAYGAFNAEAGVWSMASFYPVAARWLGTAWDAGPLAARGDLAVTQTALYDVTIDAPANLLLVATGTAIEQQRADSRQQTRFVSGPQRDFYLAALSNLDQASTVVNGTRIVSYFQPANAVAGRRALDTAAAALEVYNRRFGTYPFNELEIIQAALTTFAGVEYPGVVLIEQRLYRSNNGLVPTVAHEVAHQWWYGLVGNDVQREPWLDESLASYAQVIYAEERLGPAAAQAELDELRQRYLRALANGSDAPVNQPVDAFRSNYLYLVYGKGALFFHALRQQVGELLFARFLQSYYQQWRYRDATSADLLAAAEAACTCELDQLYSDWILSTRPVVIP